VVSNCDGQTFLRASLELLSIKESLIALKGEVDVGIKRLEAVIKSFKSRGPSLSSLDK
jgi:hypothetical protein